VKTFDVAVVGGGPSGAATALSLCQKGYAVVVAEKSRFQAVRFGETLVPKVRQLLIELGVWQRFLDDDHQKALGIQSAWGQGDLYENDFIFNPFGNGWHLDRARFDSMLLDAAEQRGALVFRDAVVAQRPENQGDGWRLVIQTNSGPISFQSRFIVDATGRSSAIGKTLGAKRRIFDRLIGVVATFATGGSASPHGGYALIESRENGWWYSADLPGDKTVAVYMTDADIYARSRRRSPDFWRDMLESSHYTKHRCEHSKMISEPQPLAANTSRLYPVAGAHWFVVGDAALSFDPLSSLGLYKALTSGISAAAAIDATCHDESDAAAHYAETLDKSFLAYLTARRTYYGKVNQWPESDFWKRRAGEFRHIRAGTLDSE
jgi:flavin-dependent dehydrogenase